MSVREDRDDFQNSGLQGLVQKLMRDTDEGFVRVHSGGWNGEIVPKRPAPGSGAYVYIKRGNPPMMHPNDNNSDEGAVPYRLI